MELEIKTNKIVNFFMLLYHLSKGKNSFDNIKKDFIDFDINKEERDIIKNTFKGEIDYELLILKNKKLNDIYNKNKIFWDEYYCRNEKTVHDIGELLQKSFSTFNVEEFKKVEKFFNKTIPEKLVLYVCAGNDSKIGIGTSFKPNACVIFPRNFTQYSKDSLDKDFAVLIHEIIHLYQTPEENEKDFMEIVTCVFAPRGILINKNKCDKNSLQEKMIPLIEEAISKNKTYFEIKQDLIKIFDKEK